MAKKKNVEKVTESHEADAGAEHAGDVEAGAAEAQASGDDTLVEAASPAFVEGEELWLVAEVQRFLSKRGELAEKLAREIEATEKKLEELKRTAALLSPQPVAAAPVEPARPDKKGKKPALKKAEKKSEKPRGLLDHVEPSGGGDAGAAVDSANPPAEELVGAAG